MTTPRAEVVAEIERELLELYRDPSLTEKPALLEQRGGAFYSEAATQLVASLLADSGDVQVVDVRNGGTLAGLADDDVVEVPARVGRGGPVPLPQRAARAGAARASSSTSPRTSASRRRRRPPATATPRDWRCWPIRWCASTGSPTACSTGCSRRTASTRVGIGR